MLCSDDFQLLEISSFLPVFKGKARVYLIDKN